MKTLDFSFIGLILLLGMAWLALPALSHAAPSGTGASHRHVLMVGPGRQYATPQQAYNNAEPGDLILIFKALYLDNDAKLNIKGTDNITFRGVGGRPHMKLSPGTRPTNGKGIWVVTANDITIENIEFSGARLATDKNGAGIRIQAKNNLTISRCYFHDNDDGILGGGNHPDSHIVIEKSEFTRNGHGDGQSHDVYISGNPILTFRYNYIHGAKNGNELKTRAHLNYIAYNKILDGMSPEYVANYEIDIPDGGVAYVIGNVIEQSAYLDDRKNNNTLLTYGEEHLHNYADNALYAINNTFVNDASSGFFIRVKNKPSLVAVNRNNIFTGVGAVVTTKGGANVTSDHNYRGDPGYVDAGSFNYHLSSSTSPAVDAGANPGTSRDGYDLTPHKQYVNVADSEDRSVVGKAIDLGAFEYGIRSCPGPRSQSGPVRARALAITAGCH
jgi:hypothetical protein